MLDRMHLVFKMQKIKYFCSFLLVVCMSIVKAQRYHEIPVQKAENFDRNLMDIEEHIYEDGKYMKAVIRGPLEFRTALRNRSRLWTDGIVPFTISDEFPIKYRIHIYEAIDEIINKTCICFQKRKNETMYIYIEPGGGNPPSCYADLGKVSNNRTVVVMHAPECFMRKGVMLHELMHALGFDHEHVRPDRDQFIFVNTTNIPWVYLYNFNKESNEKVHTFNLPYDYNSIMHYGAFAYADYEDIPTIIPLQPGVTIGQRIRLSVIDVEKINIQYNCTGKLPDC